MLCNDCTTGLKNAHILIENAIASYKILQERLLNGPPQCNDDEKIIPLEYIKEESVEFEILLPSEGDAIGDGDFLSVNRNISLNEKRLQLNNQKKDISLERAGEDENSCSMEISSTRRTSSDYLSQDSESIKSELNDEDIGDIGENQIFFKMYRTSGKERRKRQSTTLRKGKTKNTCKIKEKTHDSNDIPISETSQEESYDKSSTKKKPGMCSYCCKC